MRASLLCPLLLGAALWAAPGSVRAEPSGPAERPDGGQLLEARQHFEIALKHYAEGRYRQAIIELKRAHALDLSGKDLLYNLAVVHEKLGEVGPALSYYRRVHELEPEGPDKERIAAILRRLEGAREELIEARMAERRVLEADRSSACARGSSDTMFWTSAGVAAAAAVVSAVFGARALALSPGPSDGTGGDRDVSDVRADARAAHRSAIVADVSLLVGLVSGSVAGVLYLWRAGSPPRAEPLQAQDPSVAARAPRIGFDVGIHF